MNKKTNIADRIFSGLKPTTNRNFPFNKEQIELLQKELGLSKNEITWYATMVPKTQYLTRTEFAENSKEEFQKAYRIIRKNYSRYNPVVLKDIWKKLPKNSLSRQIVANVLVKWLIREIQWWNNNPDKSLGGYLIYYE